MVSWYWDKLCTHTWLSLVVVVPKLIYWLNFLNQLIIIKLIYHTKQYSTASNKNICFLSVSFLFPNFIITVFSKHLWSHVHISIWYVFILSRLFGSVCTELNINEIIRYWGIIYICRGQCSWVIKIFLVCRELISLVASFILQINMNQMLAYMFVGM